MPDFQREPKPQGKDSVSLYMPDVWFGRMLEPRLPRFEPEFRQAALISFTERTAKGLGPSAKFIAELEYLLTGKSAFVRRLDPSCPGWDDLASAVAGLREDRVRVPHVYQTEVYYRGPGQSSSREPLWDVRKRLEQRATPSTFTLIYYDAQHPFGGRPSGQGPSYEKGYGARPIETQAKQIHPAEFFDLCAQIPGKKLVVLLSPSAGDAYLTYVEDQVKKEGARYDDIAVIFSGRMPRDHTVPPNYAVTQTLVDTLRSHRDLSRLVLPSLAPTPNAAEGKRAFPGIESSFTVTL